jgi:DNA primase
VGYSYCGAYQEAVCKASGNTGVCCHDPINEKLTYKEAVAFCHNFRGDPCR